MMLRVALAAAAALLAAVPALAADGEILINQARANAGGVTPGDTAGFPVTLSRAGRYKLSGNLTVPAGVNGIEVTANDVSIDLNGFSIISSPAAEAPRGISAPSLTRLRVGNGTISGFRDYGIAAGDHVVLENMRILGTAASTGISLFNRSRISDSIIANNLDAILCSSCLIEHNIITGNGRDGVSAGGGQVLENVIVGNGGIGVYDGAGAVKTGYGGNILIGNNGGGGQTLGQTYQIHPNVCDPACP